MAQGLLGNDVPRVHTPPLRELTPETSMGFALINFAIMIGVPLLPWQQWLAIHMLELLPNGNFRFRTVVLLVARQNGKSTFAQVLALFFMYVLETPLVLSTAQNLDVAEEVWAGGVEMAKGSTELAPSIERVALVNGKKSLDLESGARWKVQAANRRGGRGLFFFGNLFLPHLLGMIKTLNHHENNKSHDNKIDDTLDKHTVSDYCPTDSISQSSKVNTSHQQSNNWGDDVGH